MAYLVLGVNHKQAPLAFREQIAFTADRLPQALASLCQHQAVNEAVILSTCNRTELYLVTDSGDVMPLIQWLADHHGLSGNKLAEQLSELSYFHWDEQAIEHGIRVAAGLDSMLLGEPQILGQIKTAYQLAVRAKTVGAFLGRLFQHIFSSAKRIRNSTDIGQHPVSIAYSAVKLAQQLFSHIDKRRFLLIGAGRTVRLIAQYLVGFHIEHLAIANRSHQHAQDLVNKLGLLGKAKVYHLPELIHCLSEADVVFSATASTEPVINKALVEQVIRHRKHRPIMMVDLAVPRDIEASVSEFEDVYLYTLDHLQRIVDSGQEQRKKAATEAEVFVKAEVEQCLIQLKTLEAADTVKCLLAKTHRIRDEALHKAMQELKKGRLPERVIHELAHRLTAKIMHQPISSIKSAAALQDDQLIASSKALWKADS